MAPSGVKGGLPRTARPAPLDLTRQKPLFYAARFRARAARGSSRRRPARRSGGAVRLPEIRESILDNGLKVLTAQDPGSPTVSHQLWYRVGSRHERSGATGLSHLFEHLMFKGTERFPEGAFDRIVQENGMTHNAWTGHDCTVFYENAASDRLELAMELEADRMDGLVVTEEIFRTELAVVREERRQMVEDPPFGLLAEAVDAAVFQVHPYRWPVIGWMSDLDALTLDDARAHYRTWYRPNNAVLVVAGDVEHGRVADLARRHYGRLAPGPATPTVRAIEPEQRGERTVRVHKEVRLPGIVLAFRAPAAGDRAALALNVIETLLLHGRSSRLYQRLIYREQLAVGLSGGFSLRADPSTFTLRASARPGVAIERLRDAILEALEALRREPVSEAELRKALRAVESDFVFAQESRFEVAQNLGEDECRTSWRTGLTWLQDQLSVTPEEIQRTATEVFDERKRTVGYLVPEPGAAGAGDGPDAEAEERPSG